MLRISRSLKFSAVYFGLIVCVGIVAVENRQVNNATLTNSKERNLEILEKLLKLATKNNFMGADDEENENVPTDVLDRVYTECVLKLSFPCLQKKLIAFLYKLDRMKSINLVGKTVLLVRRTEETEADATALSEVAEHVDQAYLKDVIDDLVDKFFENHSLRLRIPEYVEDTGHRDDEDGIFLDIDFGSMESSNSIRESRRRRPHHNNHHEHHEHHKHHKHHKQIKKLMMVIGLMTCIKLTLLAPLMVGLLGLKAMKALILAVMSLTISKMMMLSKVNMQNLIHGNGWYSSSGGGGGWDRNIEETSITSTLPYNMEPPAAYSTYTVRTVK